MNGEMFEFELMEW